MPYVEGESLDERLERERQLPIADAMQIAREVASALAYAHAKGFMHRDVKPANILLSQRTRRSSPTSASRERSTRPAAIRSPSRASRSARRCT